jgi:aminomethyltransferase
MPLYGHEMTDDITPLEANLGFFVKLDKDDFIGKEALLRKGEPTRRRAGLQVTGRGIVREHCALFLNDEQVGLTTSGTYCPYIGKAMAMALVDLPYTALGTAMEADVRGRRIPVEVVELPFYKRSK